jgi:hypothetical protein
MGITSARTETGEAPLSTPFQARLLPAAARRKPPSRAGYANPYVITTVYVAAYMRCDIGRG